ncbi:MAG: nucleoside deaminase [Actinobacteria bacterium]|nr:nucleoside deaminase [Actinomycetota bacterium]
MAMNARRRVAREEVPALAMSILEAVPQEDPDVAKWKSMLGNYHLDGAHPDEPHALMTCVLALQAVAEGNAGVGCMIAAADGGAVAYGHNKVFHPYFRSDLHGEMVTMNEFEDLRLDIRPGDLTLYTSLEPCPMCMARILTAGIGRVLYLARDEMWGMTEERDKLPPTWRDLAEGKVFAAAECSQELRVASSRIFAINIDELYERLKNR